VAQMQAVKRCLDSHTESSEAAVLLKMLKYGKHINEFINGSSKIFISYFFFFSRLSPNQYGPYDLLQCWE
jgi:hypothetical protein